MRSYEYTIKMTNRSLDDCYTILHNGDEHVGAKNSDEGLQEEVVKRVDGDDKCWWITTGDPCEYIIRNDPRFEDGSVPDWFQFHMMSDPVRHQIARYTQIYGKIADKLLATTMGNHDFMLMKYNSRDVYNELWDSMGVSAQKRFGVAGFLRLRFVFADKVFWRPSLYLFHGVSNGRLKSGILNELEKLPMSAQADVYCIGHAHKKVVSSDEYSVMDRITNRIVSRKRYYSATGSYTMGIMPNEDGGFAERRGFYPQALGPVELKFYPNRKEVKMVM